VPATDAGTTYVGDGWCSAEPERVLHGEWMAGPRAARLGRLAPLRRHASLPRLALSKNSDLNPPRRVPRINVNDSHVSRLLWLIVALEALAVKSTLLLWHIFREEVQLVAIKGFLRSRESGVTRSERTR